MKKDKPFGKNDGFFDSRTRRMNHICPICSFMAKGGGLCPRDQIALTPVGERYRYGKKNGTKTRKKRK